MTIEAHERFSQLRQGSVPFIDLWPSNSAIEAGLLTDLQELVRSGKFTNGPHVATFEEAFAAYCGATDCVGVASGLDALRLGLLAAGLEPGDEVIVPANTFAATFEAVTQAKGRPVVVDVSESDFNLDPRAAAAAVGHSTRFLLPVHLYGQLADMKALRAVADRHGIEVIEDACQAPGASRDGHRAGLAGTAGAFSFYPAKNLGAFGDAGALVTSRSELASRVRVLREHGQREKYRHEVEGYTARLDTIQALVLLHKLPLLDQWNEARRAAADFYLEALEGVGDLRFPPVPEGSRPVWHLFVVRTKHPTDLAEFLGSRGVQTGRHYPEPPHLSAAYAWLGYERGSFPVTEALSQEVLSLPMFPGVTEAQLERVVTELRAFFAHG